jgi:hypothetical protein
MFFGTIVSQNDPNCVVQFQECTIALVFFLLLYVRLNPDFVNHHHLLSWVFSGYPWVSGAVLHFILAFYCGGVFLLWSYWFRQLVEMRSINLVEFPHQSNHWWLSSRNHWCLVSLLLSSCSGDIEFPNQCHFHPSTPSNLHHGGVLQQLFHSLGLKPNSRPEAQYKCAV